MCKNDNDKELTSAADKLPGKQTEQNWTSFG